MQPQRWLHLKGIFNAAVELPTRARCAFIAEACDGDISLQREVRSLVLLHERRHNLDHPIESLVADAVNGILEESDPFSLVGRRLGGYEVLEHIGRGGMAAVYVAQDVRLNRRVALKFLLPDLTRDKDRLRRFHQEARVVSALNHPNILTIHEVRHVGALHFMVTELVEGRTLRRQIAESDLEIDRVVDIALQVAEALHAAHRAGVVHRDIKPDNIMLRVDGYVKVLDFGIAKLTGTKPFPTGPAGAATEPGILMGTVSYMSPEQARGLDLDHRTDIFSLGVVLYEMIAGKRPFEGATPGDKIASLLTREPEPLVRRNPRVPARLERIVSKCLEKEPGNRYQSARKLADDLDDFRQSPAHDGAEGPADRDERPEGIPAAGRRWFLFALLSAAILVAFLIAIARWAPSADGPPEVRSLAVLPLVDASAESGPENFADGMTAALIDSLSRIGRLRVISRTSAMRFKGTEKSLSEIAKELGVDALVEGNVLRSEGRARVAVKLVHAGSGRQIWANSYEQDLRNVMAMQQRIARDMATEISIELTPGERSRLTGARAVSPAAFDAYLRGQSFLSRRNEKSLKMAIRHFREALVQDPTYPLPHVGIANAYFALGTVMLGAMRPVEHPDGETHSTGHVQQRGPTRTGHPALGPDVQRRPQALRVDQNRDRDSGKKALRPTVNPFMSGH